MKYKLQGSMVTYFEKVTVEAANVEEAERLVKEAWAAGHLREDRQEFDIDAVEEIEKCDGCDAEGVHLINVTDQPDKHDGRYCEKCVEEMNDEHSR